MNKSSLSAKITTPLKHDREKNLWLHIGSMQFHI